MATPIFSESVVTPPDMAGVNRAIAYMSDGTVIAVVYRSGTGIRIYDNHTGSFDSYFIFNDDIVGGKLLSLTIDASDHLHLVYQSVAGDVRYVKFTYGGSYSWTAGTSELVRTLPGSTVMGKKDIEVLSSGVVVVSWLETNVTVPTARIPAFKMRVRNSGGTWGTTLTLTEMATGSSSSRCCSIARDGEDDTATPDAGYQRVAYAYSIPNAVGFKFGHVRVKLDDGSIDQQTEVAKYGDRGMSHYGNLFSHGAGEWTFIGQKNHVASLTLNKTMCFRWKYGVGYTEQTTAQDQMDSAWPQATGTAPASALVGGKPVVITSFALNGRVSLMARVYHPSVGWGPQFALAEGSASSASVGVGSEFIRSGGNRNLPATRIHVASTMARMDITTATTRAHYVHTNDAPSVPTNLSPGVLTTSGSPSPVVSTSAPVLSAKTNTVSSGPVRRRLEWQVDKAELFNVDARIYSQTVADLAFAGATHSKVVPGDNPLYTDEWYHRVRSIDEFGRNGNWSSIYRFEVLHPPSTLDWSPTGGILTGYGTGDVLLRWGFSDPYSADTQSAYQVIVTLESDGTVVLDTNKVTSAVSEATVTISNTYKDVNLQWRVDVWDADDTKSTNVAFNLFALGDAPSVTIDSPADDDILTSPLLDAEWTATFGGSRTQQKYQVSVWNLSENELAYSSGWVTSSDVTHTVPAEKLENECQYRMTVSVIDSGNLGNSAEVEFTASWTPPAGPDFTVDSSMFDEEGYVEITWDDTAQEDDFSHWLVEARNTTAQSGDFTRRISAVFAGPGTVQWGALAGGGDWTIEVRQVVNRYGVDIPSASTPEPLELVCTSYWLVPQTSVMGGPVRLYNVIEDNPAEDQDYETHKLIGRGNRDDLGTHYGWASSLVCQLRDKGYGGPTARQQKDSIVALRRSGKAMLLRTPFGDLFQVNLGLLSFARVPGVGQREFTDITIPYHEVAVGNDFTMEFPFEPMPLPNIALFSYTGAQQTWTVPVGVTEVMIDVVGGGGATNSGITTAGKGARVETTLTVTPGQTLYLYVGGAGSESTGGWNGGGNGGINSFGSYPHAHGGGGGGASDIRIGGTAYTDRVVVAGGGGGGGGESPWGTRSGGAGGHAGELGSGAVGGIPGYGNGAGGGATENSGVAGNGAGGGQGGAGAGGGGGWAAGGRGDWTAAWDGSSSGPGGGGGSSHSDGTNTTFTTGHNAGSGSITLVYFDA